MVDATAIVHASPALGAGFTQYTAEFSPGGTLGPCAEQRFIYVLEGEISLGGCCEQRCLHADEYAYLPPANETGISAPKNARALVIEKRYIPLPGADHAHRPEFLIGDEKKISPTTLDETPGLDVRILLPEDSLFDFAVNTMTYQPGAALAMVEVHVMEHGLLMLAGGGIYRLGDRWYPVTAGDFIWMAPWCPQWFGAIGQTPAKYLIYKDWNRY